MCEYETIARNLLILSQKAGGWLVGFTFSYYVEHAEHEHAEKDRGWFDEFAEAGFLDREGDLFSINKVFISRIRLLKPGEHNKEPLHQ